MNSNITPRPGTEDDLDQVVAMESYCNRPPWSRSAFAAELKKNGAHFWLLTDDETDERVMAYIVFSFLGEQAHIQTLGVDRVLRRRGMGTRLMRFVINFVLRQGGDSIYLEVRKSNSAAVALYQRLGFVVIRTVSKMYPDGEDAYAMLFRFNPETIKSKAPSEEEEPSGSKTHLN